jgi:hypothetical protein
VEAFPEDFNTKATYFCLDIKVAKDQAEVFKTGSLILR